MNSNAFLEIADLAVEPLAFTCPTGGDGVEVPVECGAIWLPPKNIAALGESRPKSRRIHSLYIFEKRLLDEEATAAAFSVVQTGSKLPARRNFKHGELDASVERKERRNSP